MIEVQKVVKTFEGFRALDGLTMTVPDGSIYGLVGPNGAGKSTILRHITGIYRQDEGKVLVAGEPVYENPAVKARRPLLHQRAFAVLVQAAHLAEQRAHLPALFRVQRFPALHAVARLAAFVGGHLLPAASAFEHALAFVGLAVPAVAHRRDQLFALGLAELVPGRQGGGAGGGRRRGQRGRDERGQGDGQAGAGEKGTAHGGHSTWVRGSASELDASHRYRSGFSSSAATAVSGS